MPSGVDQGLALFLSGLLAFWTVAYALGRGRGGKIEVGPGVLLARAGISLDPMPPGPARAALVAFGYLSLVLLMISAALFYYYTLYVFTLKYIIRPPQPVQGFAPLIPGVTLGWRDTVYVLVALGVAAFFHETAHALVSRAVGVRIKDAGVALFLFIPAAFVEPDEEELMRAPLRSRALIYSAGVGANVILALAFLALLAQAAPSLAVGVQVVSVSPGSPAAQAGLRPGDIIVAVNGTSVRTLEDLARALEEHGVKDPQRSAVIRLTVRRGGETIDVVVRKPAGETRIGVLVKPAFRHAWLVVFSRASYLLNLSLALVNAAPLAIPLPGGSVLSDGANLLKDALEPRLGREAATRAAVAVGLATLLLVLSLMSLTRLQIS